MGTQFVSVVIPAYNSASFLASSIESALAQTHRALEVVVINDGSTDETATVLASFGSRIRVVSQANRGLPAARNAGIAVSVGEWVAFLDADDWWLPEKLEKQLAMATDPAVGLIYSNRYNAGARGDLPEVQSSHQSLYSGDIFVDLLRLGNHLTASSVMVRRSIVNELGGFAEHLGSAEDWDLWIRVAARWRVAVSDEPLVSYRFHAGMMSGNPDRMAKARNEVVDRALASPRGLQLSSRLRRHIRSATTRTNAWDVARSGRRFAALRLYLNAVALNPTSRTAYADLLRVLAGRL